MSKASTTGYISAKTGYVAALSKTGKDGAHIMLADKCAPDYFVWLHLLLKHHVDGGYASFHLAPYHVSCNITSDEWMNESAVI